MFQDARDRISEWTRSGVGHMERGRLIEAVSQRDERPLS